MKNKFSQVSEDQIYKKINESRCCNGPKYKPPPDGNDVVRERCIKKSLQASAKQRRVEIFHNNILLKDYFNFLLLKVVPQVSES